MRRKLFGTANENMFRFRGKEIFRIEALSDAVFAFTVSLLAASLEVPQTFAELEIIIKGAVPFFFTVALVFLFWYQQYKFFRRYGLNDLVTIVLNLAYLAVIIFYVYPLKFLFSLFISSWFGIDLFEAANETRHVVLSNSDLPALIMVFSTGYMLVWLIIYLLHRHVLHISKALSFTPYEKIYTQKELRGALWNFCIGISALVLAFMHFEILAGICYLLIPFILILNQILFKKKCKQTIKTTIQVDEHNTGL